MERIQAAIQKAKGTPGRRRARGPGRRPGRPGRPGTATRTGVRTAASPTPGAGPAWAELALRPGPAADGAQPDRDLRRRRPGPYDMMRTRILRAMRQRLDLARHHLADGGLRQDHDHGEPRLLLRPPAGREDGARRPRPARPGGGEAARAHRGAVDGERAAGHPPGGGGTSCAMARTSRSAPTPPACGARRSSCSARRRRRGWRRSAPPSRRTWCSTDLPPLLASDDVMAFLPHLDCVLLIAAAERSRLDEVDECEQPGERSRPLGVVLDECRYMGEDSATTRDVQLPQPAGAAPSRGRPRRLRRRRRVSVAPAAAPPAAPATAKPPGPTAPRPGRRRPSPLDTSRP